MAVKISAAKERVPPSVADPSGAADATGQAIFPFVGPVLHYVPGATITVERRLNLEEDLFLADHAFVYAPGVKPVSACLPVLPMTMSLEAMAEVAACLAPGFGLLGFEEVKAARWIDLVDTDTLTLHIAAQVDHHNTERGAYRIKAAIYIEGQTSPAISATVLFGGRYLVELSLTFNELSNAYGLTAERIYSERHMFHGPSFQCLAGEIVVGDEGLVGELIVLSPEGLFYSARRPQLLTHPTLLDAIGQVIGVWGIEHDRYVFPIRLTKLEIYCPTPPAGTPVPVRVEITHAEAKTLHANVEVQNGAGAVWMRIADWQSWTFRWRQRLVNFRRLPHKHLLGEAAPLPNLDDGSVCVMLAATELEDFKLGNLARYWLSMEEMRVFHGYARAPQRQQQWLLGRIVAKDAVRCWVAEKTQAAMLHPAAFTVDSDAHGRPLVSTLPGCDMLPLLSIAHCEGRAIAAAHGEAVGVDIERIAARDAGFVQTLTTVDERNMIQNFPAAERHVWITRLWCAREAVGKLLGTGIDGAPRALEAIRIENDGQIQIGHRASARVFRVKTVENLGFIIAYASQPQRVLAEEV